MSPLKANTQVGFNIKPMYSQVVLVSLSIIAILILSASLYLLIIGIEQWSWFFGLSIAIFLAVIIGWFVSHRDNDLLNAHSTALTLPNGTTVVTDTRALSHPESAKVLSRIMTEAIDRKDLPPPTGTVDAAFKPVPNSYETAQDNVNLINSLVKEIADKILGSIRIENEKTILKQNNITNNDSPLKAPPKA